MLNNIPNTINRLTRLTVLNHPNAWGAFVLRKQVDRVGSTNVGGLPTLGGLAVLSSEDEEKISYEHVGNARALLAEMFAVSTMQDRRDVSMGAGEEYRFLIEPEDDHGTSGWFEAKKRDLLYLVIGADFDTAPKVAYEIVDIETTSNIPPFTQRYICNRRSEMDAV